MSFFRKLTGQSKSGKQSFKSNDPFEVQKLFIDKQKPVVFDIGAYVGELSVRYAVLFPQGRVYAFEPFEESFTNLRELTRQHPNICSVNSAVLDFAGTTEFNINNDPTCNSIFPRPVDTVKYYSPRAENIRTVKVNATTVDDFCSQRQIDCIDILKIDVEGAETKVFSGAAQMLTRQAIDLVYCEVMFISHYQGGCLYHDIAAHLGGYGYSLFNLFNLKQASDGQLRWGNAIFISPQLRKKIASGVSTS